MEFDYGFEYAFPEMAESAIGIATGILLILWFLAMGFSIVMYVLNAVGMYRITKRRGIHHAWLAWIPVGCNWLLGSRCLSIQLLHILLCHIQRFCGSRCRSCRLYKRLCCLL